MIPQVLTLSCYKCCRVATIAGDMADAVQKGWVSERWTDSDRMVCPKCPAIRVKPIYANM